MKSSSCVNLVFRQVLSCASMPSSPNSCLSTPAHPRESGDHIFSGGLADCHPEGCSEATTLDNVSVVDINIVSEDAGGASEEAHSEQSTTAASSIKGKQKEEAPGSNSSKEDGNEPVASSNLVGKMNNLISTDLENLVDRWDILLLSLWSCPSLHVLSPLLMNISP